MKKKQLKKLAAAVLFTGVSLGVTGLVKPSQIAVEESE